MERRVSLKQIKMLAKKMFAKEDFSKYTGTCSIIVQKYFGGVILRTKVDGKDYFYNRINGYNVDLAKEVYNIVDVNERVNTSKQVTCRKVIEEENILQNFFAVISKIEGVKYGQS